MRTILAAQHGNIRAAANPFLADFRIGDDGTWDYAMEWVIALALVWRDRIDGSNPPAWLAIDTVRHWATDRQDYVDSLIRCWSLDLDTIPQAVLVLDRVRDARSQAGLFRDDA